MQNLRQMKNYRKIKNVAIALLALLFFNTSFSQIDNDYFTVKGKVIDKKTKNEIIFVMVSVKGTNIATVTNTEGEFVINIDNKYKNNELTFNYIGYKTKQIKLNNFNAEKNIISLNPTAISINEVIVRPENPKELILKIIEEIPTNYSNEPNKMMAFYKETVKRRNRYKSISEAVVEVYKASYSNQLDKDLVKLYKGRKSTNVKSQDTLIMKLKGGPETTLLLDIAKNPDLLFYKESIDDYKFEIDDIITINNKQNYVIKFTQIKNFNYPLFNGKLYVDIKTLGILAAEFSLNLEDKVAASRLFVRKKPLTMSIRTVATKYYVKYTENNGKYYFTHARGEVTFKCKWKKRLFNSKYTVMSEIAITDRSDENVIKFPRKDRLKSSIIFEEKVQELPDTNFWGKYNTIKPEESIQNAIKKYGVKLKIQNN